MTTTKHRTILVDLHWTRRAPRRPAPRRPDALEQVCRGLAEVLARVAHDFEGARSIARRAGFPAEHLPEFRTATLFWSSIVEQAANGRIRLDALVGEAVRQFPYNPRLLDFEARLTTRRAARRRRASRSPERR